MFPITHDIIVMWNAGWDSEKGQRGVSYIAGIEGWWNKKVGIEKSPDYLLNVATPLFSFSPGQIYRIQAGSVDGHCFVCVDGNLVLEVTDPSPINSNLYTKIGFEAYASFIQIRNVKVRSIIWDSTNSYYIAEF